MMLVILGGLWYFEEGHRHASRGIQTHKAWGAIDNSSSFREHAYIPEGALATKENGGNKGSPVSFF